MKKKRSAVKHVKNFSYSDELYHAAVAQSSGGGSKSKYKGGFIVLNNRLNNSKAYNHDYYEKNKEKWKKDSKIQRPEDKKKKGFLDNLSDLYNMTMDQIQKFIEEGKNFLEGLFDSKTTIDSGFKPEIPEILKPIVDKPEVYSFDMGDPWDNMMDNRREKTEQEEYAEKYAEILHSKNDRFKYTYKVKTENGKYRYFYSYAEYYSFMNNVKQKDRECTIQEDMSAVNVAYSNYSDKQLTEEEKLDRKLNRENCGFCTYAYDLRRRGYDVKAIRNKDGIGAHSVLDLYEDENGNHPSMSYSDSSSSLFKELAKNGDGASGYMSVSWEGGGGHSLAWQVVKGKAYVLDCQTNTIYDEDDFNKYIDSGAANKTIKRYENHELVSEKTYKYDYFRSDNLKLSENGSLHTGAGQFAYTNASCVEKNNETRILAYDEHYKNKDRKVANTPDTSEKNDFFSKVKKYFGYEPGPKEEIVDVSKEKDSGNGQPHGRSYATTSGKHSRRYYVRRSN